MPTLPHQSYAVGGLTQGGVSRGRYTGIADAASRVVSPYSPSQSGHGGLRFAVYISLATVEPQIMQTQLCHWGGLNTAGEFPADRC